MTGNRPTYGQPIHVVTFKDDVTPNAETEQLLNRIEDRIMSIIQRQLAGASILRITDEIRPGPVSIVDDQTMEIPFVPTPQTKEDTDYIVGVRLDSSPDEALVTSLRWTQVEIDALTVKSVTMRGSEFFNANVIVVEIGLDAAANILDIQNISVALGTVGDPLTVELTLSMGSEGLTGLDFTIILEDNGMIVNPQASSALGLVEINPIDPQTINIRGVDLADSLNPNETANIATLTVDKLMIGTARITATMNIADSEDGFPVRTAVVDGIIEITA